MIESDSMTAAVETDEVSKKYGHMVALHPISLKINDGDFVALLGPNGAGKTTLMKMTATHLLPSSGSVRIYGKDVVRSGEKVREKIGFVAHESFLYDELTVEENLLFYQKFFPVNQDLKELVALLGLEKWYRALVKQLSYGLRKRADIARALVHNPNLLIIDELFAGLDEETCSLMVSYFREQEEKALLISSHSLEWAKRLCKRGIFLNKGKLVRDTRF